MEEKTLTVCLNQTRRHAAASVCGAVVELLREPMSGEEITPFEITIRYNGPEPLRDVATVELKEIK